MKIQELICPRYGISEVISVESFSFNSFIFSSCISFSVRERERDSASTCVLFFTLKVYIRLLCSSEFHSNFHKIWKRAWNYPAWPIYNAWCESLWINNFSSSLRAYFLDFPFAQTFIVLFYIEESKKAHTHWITTNVVGYYITNSLAEWYMRMGNQRKMEKRKKEITLDVHIGTKWCIQRIPQWE